MKVKYKNLSKALIITFTLCSGNLMAQDESNLVRGSSADATKLIAAYFNPALKGVGVGLNSAFASSAKSVGMLRFDVRFGLTLVNTAKQDRSFDVSKLNLETLTPANPTKTITPTFMGGNANGIEMRNNRLINTTFRLPDGVLPEYVPTPQLQLTVGLPQHIDLSIRYIPTLDFKENGKFGLIGVGAKVEILPLILGNTGKIIPVDIAIAGGYTKFNYEVPLDVNNNQYRDQRLEIDIDGYSAEAIVSKKFMFVTPYASVGYHSAQHKLNALGTYEFNNVKEVDPVKINEKNLNHLKATAGLQLKLAVLKLFASYTISESNYINFGFALGTGK